jgi:uncharacterized damage-inducible protein DinB
LGRLAWHIVTSFPVSVFGIEQAQETDTVPSSAKAISENFRSISAAISEAVEAKWTDETLKDVRVVFGAERSLETALPLVMKHLIHHRGQLTILMRQAGLQVPGLYGPARDEWAAIGLATPRL